MEILKEDHLLYIISCLEKWGNSSSIVALERDDCHIYKNKNDLGINIYFVTKKYFIVFGDPVCDKIHLSEFVSHFNDFCSVKKKKAIYINCSTGFARIMRNEHNHAIIDYGDELSLDTHKNFDDAPGAYASLLRRNFKAAERLALTIHEYKGESKELEKKIEDMAHEWRNNRKGFQAGVIPLNIFKNKINKRWFYAQDKERIVGLLTLNKFNQRHFVINLLIHLPNSPRGTSEFLTLKTIQILKEENVHRFYIGVTPKPQLGLVETNNKHFFLHLLYNTITKFLKNENKQRFWKKFEPTFDNLHLIIPDKKIRLTHIFSILKAVKA